MVVKAVRKKGGRKKIILPKSEKGRRDMILAEAVRNHQSGNLEKAEMLYKEILVSDPDHADALHLLGVIGYQTGNNKHAVEYIQKAISIHSANSYYHNNLGNAFLNLKETDKAIKCFTEAILLNKNNIEAYNNLGNALREKGELEEALIQYRMAVELNPEYAIAINNIANLLKATDRLEESLQHYNRAVKLEPGRAELYFNLANALAEMKRFNEAAEQYRMALEIRPDFAEAHNDLGNVLKKMDRLDDAIKHYQNALSLKPGFAIAHNNLADTYRLSSAFDSAIEQSDTAIRLEPDNEEFYVNLGNIYHCQGNYQKAVDQYQKAIDLKNDLADAHYNKGLILLTNSAFKEGWKEYEWRFLSKEVALDIGFRDVGIPTWDGSYLKDKTILIMTEQGMGDSIQFFRYLPLIKERAGKIIFECPNELRRLFSSSINSNIQLIDKYSDDSEFKPDVCIHLLSIPGIFGTEIGNIAADIPYLKVAPEIARKWSLSIDSGGFKVGLIWSGNPNHTNDRNRSCRPSDLLPLSFITGVQFYNFQKSISKEDLNEIPASMKIKNIAADFDDFYDTAAAIQNMDLIITVDTAVAHLAGALGKEVWTLIPFVPDWRWMLNREDTPWYPTMRLFRQPEYGDWDSVINKVICELEKQVHLKGAPNEQ